jgi:hypothetical protein
VTVGTSIGASGARVVDVVAAAVVEGVVAEASEDGRTAVT